MAASIAEVRAEQVTRLDQVVKAAEPAREAARVEVDLARADATAATAVLTALQAVASTLSQKLAAAEMGADRHAFELDLDENLLAQRAAARQFAVASARVEAATRVSDRIIADEGRARAHLAQATADLALATADDAATARWRLALAPGGAAAVAIAEAGAAESGALAAAAEVRLSAELGGDELLELARARQRAAAIAADEMVDAAGRALTAVHAVLTARSIVDGELARAAEHYGQVRETVRLVAVEAPADLLAIRVVLLAARDDPAPSGDVLARIAARAADAVAGGATAAVRNLTDAIAADTVARAELEAKTLPKAAIDPAYDPEQDDDAAAERAAAATAAQVLTAAQAALTPELAVLVESWDLAVPLELAASAAAALAGAEALIDLSDVDVEALLAELDAADEAYAAAIERQLEVLELQDAADAELADRLAALPGGR